MVLPASKDAESQYLYLMPHHLRGCRTALTKTMHLIGKDLSILLKLVQISERYSQNLVIQQQLKLSHDKQTVYTPANIVMQTTCVVVVFYSDPMLNLKHPYSESPWKTPSPSSCHHNWITNPYFQFSGNLSIWLFWKLILCLFQNWQMHAFILWCHNRNYFQKK